MVTHFEPDECVILFSIIIFFFARVRLHLRYFIGDDFGNAE